MPDPARKSTAFLDTNTIASFLQHSGAAAHLFDDYITKRVQFAISPVILQELMILINSRLRTIDENEFTKFASNNNITIIQPKFSNNESIIKQLNVLRNISAHSNDVLIASSALECDYLVTEDVELRKLIEGRDRPIVATPDQFIEAVSKE